MLVVYPNAFYISNQDNLIHIIGYLSAQTQLYKNRTSKNTCLSTSNYRMLKDLYLNMVASLVKSRQFTLILPESFIEDVADPVPIYREVALLIGETFGSMVMLSYQETNTDTVSNSLHH